MKFIRISELICALKFSRGHGSIFQSFFAYFQTAEIVIGGQTLQSTRIFVKIADSQFPC